MAAVLNISAQEANQLLDKGEAVLIDVRQAFEHRGEKIGHAVNVPVEQVTAQLVEKHLHDNKTVIFHCQSGARSRQTATAMAENVSADIYDLEGGIEGWKSAGLPTLKASSAPLPLNRQVQLVISIMILTGLLVYYFISPLGLILPFFAGLGLLNAALTGWCGMAKLLALMPWNK